MLRAYVRDCVNTVLEVAWSVYLFGLLLWWEVRDEAVDRLRRSWAVRTIAKE